MGRATILRAVTGLQLWSCRCRFRLAAAAAAAVALLLLLPPPPCCCCCCCRRRRLAAAAAALAAAAVVVAAAAAASAASAAAAAAPTTCCRPWYRLDKLHRHALRRDGAATARCDEAPRGARASGVPGRDPGRGPADLLRRLVVRLRQPRSRRRRRRRRARVTLAGAAAAAPPRGRAVAASTPPHRSHTPDPTAPTRALCRARE